MTVKISGETEETIRKFAKHRGIEAAPALDRLVATGFSRLMTLEKFSKSMASEKKGSAKKGGAKKSAAKKVNARKPRTPAQHAAHA